MRFSWDDAVKQGLVSKDEMSDAIKQSEKSPLNRSAGATSNAVRAKVKKIHNKPGTSKGLDVISASLLPYELDILKEVRDTQHYRSLCYLSRHYNEYESDQEHWDQVYIFHYMHVRHQDAWKLLHATPNAGKRSMRERCYVTSEGLKSGFPDMSLEMARGKYFGLRVELKRLDRTPCSLSDDQKEWLARLTEQGYFAAVAFGFEDCINILLEYISMKSFDGQTEMKCRGRRAIALNAIWRR